MRILKISICHQPFAISHQNGSVLISLLITAATFSIIVYSLLAVIATQFDFSFRQVAHDQSLNIAEAGVNYYRWHLLQAPADFQDGTGTSGPYIHDYRDPQGTLIGKYSLEIIPPDQGSSVLTIKSTGWTTDFPTVKRTVVVRLGQSSYASYAFLNNASLWFGTGITVNGKIHGNNGIRQDGVNASTVTSAVSTYTCGSETGCNPPQTKPAVWGIGEDQSLWEFPVPAVDFDTLSFDFVQMRNQAQANGVYYGVSGDYGYNVVFNANATVSIYRVTSSSRVDGYAVEDGCQLRRQIINNQTLLGTYTVSETPIIFLEDRTWVSGVVNGKTTLVAARFPTETYSTDIWINNNLTYLAKDGNHSLGIIAQHDIYYARDIPDNFEIDAALMAQQGHIIRHGYLSFCGSHPNAVRNSLTIYGSLISNLKSYWNFGTTPSSGFRTRTTTFDPNLVYEPPPYYPTVGGYDFLSWNEE
ncbi:MAG: hypothetical protein A2785_03105 [Candidatus Chisholmbacteria bacterium RIFCSPHIGHO2_01_FULL_49_18]|uniref:DUF4900 domain-containing protein n=2 Tax=Candidatus Chisholmiibacteriota TaxID=1817900 RepID=A0A1G1VMJ1_9BACT|nr:MAG: hypothetical protein A2785_03105 [Candidatus Chisholmbacteria bacterium RIFCSPHIGHO2_01_FULL_49_18]OGY20987.1 MAG: hypothetical protein A3A65_01595 [Candidatus Chisholmbacteria bacterium RIFCSPLOWO2_01_FULL_49_14]